MSNSAIRVIGLAMLAAMLLAAVVWALPPKAAQAAPLTCSGTAANVVGAHAGSLSIRVGVTVQCDEAAHLELILPGGARGEFDTDLAGAFMGIAGDAYVCSGHPQPVSVLATSPTGAWSGTFPIGEETGAPVDPDGPGPICDVMLHPSFTYFTYEGAVATPAAAFADANFTAVLPFGSSSSLNGSNHIIAVFEYVPGQSPASWSWISWRPSAPAFANQLHALAPGHSYAVLTDAELAWVVPPLAAP
jgi:hypothetical protein